MTSIASPSRHAVRVTTPVPLHAARPTAASTARAAACTEAFNSHTTRPATLAIRHTTPSAPRELHATRPTSSPAARTIICATPQRRLPSYMTVASRIITHQAICQSTSTFTSKATRPVTRAAAKTTTTQSKPTTSDTLLAHETAPWEVPGYEHLGLDTFVSKVGLTTAVVLMPVTPIESVEAASDYIRDTKAHFVFATIEVGKAHAAVRKTAVCAHNLRLKIESARRAIDTCGFKDMMYLVDIAALGLEMATTKEMNLSCLAARNILAHRNASVNIAEQIAINAMATSDRVDALCTNSRDDFANMYFYARAAKLAAHSARWRMTAWEALTDEHAKRRAPTTAWLKHGTSSNRRVTFAD